MHIHLMYAYKLFSMHFHKNVNEHIVDISYSRRVAYYKKNYENAYKSGL